MQFSVSIKLKLIVRSVEQFLAGISLTYQRKQKQDSLCITHVRSCSHTKASVKLTLVKIICILCLLPSQVYDLKSSGHCSFGPCLASCFKTTRNSKLQEELKRRIKETDNKSRHSILFVDSMIDVTVDIDNQNRIGKLIESLTDYDAILVQIESNFNFKERATHLTRSSCYTVQSCKQNINTFLCLYRAKEDNGCHVNKASN